MTDITDSMRIPIYDWLELPEHKRHLRELAASYCHRSCWTVFDDRDLLAALAISGARLEFKSAVVEWETKHTAGWYPLNIDPDLSLGMVYLGRSAKTFPGMIGIDSKWGEVRCPPLVVKWFHGFLVEIANGGHPTTGVIETSIPSLSVRVEPDEIALCRLQIIYGGKYSSSDEWIYIDQEDISEIRELL